MAQITQIKAREILDSRGLPTIEGVLILSTGQEVRAQASSGSSVGKNEGIELRDNDARYDGMGVSQAVSYINNLINPKLKGVDISRSFDIDRWLIAADGTKNRSKLGVNTIMTVSQLVWKGAAAVTNTPFYKHINLQYNGFTKSKLVADKIPSPIFSIINGGKHGSTNVEFQEFHIIPPTSKTYSKALELCSEIYGTLKQVLDYRNASVSVSEEGGFTPNLLSNVDALELIKEAINERHLKLGVDVFLGLDCAANFYYKNGKYSIKDKPQPLVTEEYIKFLKEITNEYSILILEDPLQEEDFEGWKKITEALGGKTYIVGDDFTAGNNEQVIKALEQNACSAVIIKFNQVSTITELLELTLILKQKNTKTVFSQRLGETTDSIISDIAVGIGADFVKFGSPARGERVVKYNRLLEIESELLQGGK